MITSTKGQRMLESISSIYEQSLVMQAIMESVGAEWDDTEALSDDVLRQLFPQTATWGIVYWEAPLKIPINSSISLEQRRVRVLAKMQTRWPVTRGRMEQIVQAYSGDKKAYIREFISEYRFDVLFDLVQSVDLEAIYEIVSETRPAHLDYSLVMGLKQGKPKVFVGSAMLVGEEITVYPWSVSELTGSGDIYLAAGYDTGSEEVTVYPKGSE